MSLDSVVIWTCPHCAFRAQKPAGEFAAVFHNCPGPKRRHLNRQQDRDEERQAWAASLLGAELERSVLEKYGDEAMERRL